MNAGRLIVLKPGSLVTLKTERQVKQLIALGYLQEVIELKKEKPKKPRKKKIRPFKKSKGKSETKVREKSEQVEEAKSKQE